MCQLLGTYEYKNKKLSEAGGQPRGKFNKESN